MIGAEVKLPATLPGPVKKNCPKCNQELQLFTHAQARNVVCEKCERLFEIRSKGMLSIKQFQNEKTANLIPLGTKGRLNDIPYQVVGFILYEERDSPARWREYVLFNPVAGYAFLSEYNGHWNYFHFLTDYTHGDGHFQTVKYQNTSFELFHRYGAKVIYAAGEFYWNITSGSPYYTEYIAPPYIITRIRSEKELSWLLGQYQEPEVIKEAFGLEATMPERIDIGATEVFSGGLSFEKIKKVTLWAAGVLFALQVILSIASNDARVAEAKFQIPDTAGSLDPRPIVGPTFKLQSGFFNKSNIEVHLSSPVQNDWFGAGITLFNTTTGQEYDIEMGVEYYSGYDEGQWTEGSINDYQILSALPDGEYQMFIRPFSSGAKTADVFYIAVTHDVSMWSNFWVILGLLGIFPALQYYRERNFEKRRWMNSDYSPYDEY